MQKVVLDTNILISAAISPHGSPCKIVSLVFDEQLQVFYNEDILSEYKEVLSRPRFGLKPEEQAVYINGIEKGGVTLKPPKSTFYMVDETDRKFYDLAKAAGAYLITGNAKHFPNEPFIVTPSSFVEMCTLEGDLNVQ